MKRQSRKAGYGKQECSFVQATCADSTLCGKMPLYQQLGKNIPRRPEPGLFPWQVRMSITLTFSIKGYNYN